MGRQPCCDKFRLKRGPWTIEEDHKLMSFILNNGIQCWRNIPKLAGLLRCGKSCRLRWINYLRPDLKRGGLSEMEENQIIELHARLGNRWSKIASHFPGRTDNEIKNHWNTRIKKRLKLQGLDPLTHKLPIDQKENDKEKNESEEIESNLQNEEKMFVDNIPIPIQGNAQVTEETTKNETGTSYDLMSNYELMYKNLDMDIWTMNDQSMEESTSFGKSNIYVHDESSMMMQQWVGSVDSMLSWDFCFNNQQFFSNFQQ